MGIFSWLGRLGVGLFNYLSYYLFRYLFLFWSIFLFKFCFCLVSWSKCIVWMNSIWWILMNEWIKWILNEFWMACCDKHSSQIDIWYFNLVRNNLLIIIIMNYLIIMIQEGCCMGREFKFKGSCDIGRGTKSTLNLPFSGSSKLSSGRWHHLILSCTSQLILVSVFFSHCCLFKILECSVSGCSCWYGLSIIYVNLTSFTIWTLNY